MCRSLRDALGGAAECMRCAPPMRASIKSSSCSAPRASNSGAWGGKGEQKSLMDKTMPALQLFFCRLMNRAGPGLCPFEKCSVGAWAGSGQ